jgi:hypothetical protein
MKYAVFFLTFLAVSLLVMGTAETADEKKAKIGQQECREKTRGPSVPKCFAVTHGGTDNWECKCDCSIETKKCAEIWECAGEDKTGKSDCVCKTGVNCTTFKIAISPQTQPPKLEKPKPPPPPRLKEPASPMKKAPQKPVPQTGSGMLERQPRTQKPGTVKVPESVEPSGPRSQQYTAPRAGEQKVLRTVRTLAAEIDVKCKDKKGKIHKYTVSTGTGDGVCLTYAVKGADGTYSTTKVKCQDGKNEGRVDCTRSGGEGECTYSIGKGSCKAH